MSPIKNNNTIKQEKCTFVNKVHRGKIKIQEIIVSEQKIGNLFIASKKKIRIIKKEKKNTQYIKFSNFSLSLTVINVNQVHSRKRKRKYSAV